MVRTRPLSTDWLKSPRRSSSVGSVRTIVSGLLSSHCSSDVKKNIDSSGSAADRPAVHLELACRAAPLVAAGDRARSVGDGVQAGVAKYVARSWKLFVPDFMLRLMTPPRLWPFSASTLFFEIVISSTASIDGVYAVL
jgi:hypothetical protein